MEKRACCCKYASFTVIVLDNKKQLSHNFGQPYWQAKQFWKTKNGAIELSGCDTYLNLDGSAITTQFDDDSWRQKWTVVTHEAVLFTEHGGLNQEWEVHFADAPYNYALLPSFPGSTPCLKVTTDSANLAHGYVNVYVDSGGGYEEITTSCCFDGPTNSDQYFGIEVSL